MLVNVIVMLVFGGLIGWVASLIMGTNGQQGIALNIIIGIAGAFIASWLFGSVLGFGGAFTAGSLTLVGLGWTLAGSIILIIALKILRILR